MFFYLFIMRLIQTEFDTDWRSLTIIYMHDYLLPYQIMNDLFYATYASYLMYDSSVNKSQGLATESCIYLPHYYMSWLF